MDGVVAVDEESGREIRVSDTGRHQRDGPVRGRRSPPGRPGRHADDRPEPGRPPGVRPVLPAGPERHHGAAHERRPRDVRHPVARPHAGRHHRHADSRAVARAAGARRRGRVHPRDRRAVPAPGAHARRRAERVGRDPAARPRRRRRIDRGPVARSHDPHRTVGPADDRRRQVDHLPPHGRGRGEPGGDAGAAAREGLRDADPEHPRLPSPRGEVRRARRVRLRRARHPGPDARPPAARRSACTRRCPTRRPR